MQRAQPDDKARHASLRPDRLTESQKEDATVSLFMHQRVIDAYARRIVGWRVKRTAHAGFVLDALEQALADRRPSGVGALARAPLTPGK
jgi:transposase InsO family protein